MEMNGSKKRTHFGGPKEKKGKKGLSEGNDGFQEGVRPYQPDTGASKDFHQNQGRGKDQKGQRKKGTLS